jgi:integrase
MKVRVFQNSKEKARLGAARCPWACEWTENGRRVAQTLGSKEDAEEFAAVKRAALLNRIKGIRPDVKWDAFVQQYMTEKVHASGKRPGTIKEIKLALARFKELCKPRWVHQIEELTLDQFCRRRFSMHGIHKQKIRPATVEKELRHVRAALSVAKRWKYIAEVPAMPEILGDQREKAHVTEDHFALMMKAAEVATFPDIESHKLPPECAPADWWRALFATAWVTGARISAILRLRWEDLDWDSGRILSRAAATKQRRDARPDIKAALPYVEKIAGGDPRLFPWNHAARTLYREFKRIQEAAVDDQGNRLIDLPCRDADNEGHTCNAWCHVYGFHAFRYAHARVNWANPQLQNQMGHACRATTEHYRQWAERQFTEYGATLPEIDTTPSGDVRGNTGEDSGEPCLRLFTA